MGCVARALRDEQRDTKVRKELRQQLRLRMEEIDHLRGEQEELRQPNPNPNPNPGLRQGALGGGASRGAHARTAASGAGLTASLLPLPHHTSLCRAIPHYISP